MKTFTSNKWTVAFVAMGLISARAAFGWEEAFRETKINPEEFTLSGYVDVSAIWAFSEPKSFATGAVPPQSVRWPGRLYDTPAKKDGFNLNSVALIFDKPAAERDTWSAGFHVQTLFGPDATLRNSYSLASGGITDFSLYEAYVTVHTPPGNGLEFRMGYFTSPLGYEVYDSYRNPNYSRSYGFYIEPKAHTGLTVKYDFADWVSAMAGVANSYSPFIDARASDWGNLTYIGVLNFNAGSFWRKDATLKLGYTGGHTATGAPTDVTPRIHSFYAGAHIPLPVDGLALGLAYDYQANFAAGWPAQFFFPPGPAATYANAAAMYLTYDIAKWQFHTRAEYASGTQGFLFNRSSAFGSTKPMFGDHNEEFLGVTATVGYQFWQNVLSRVEFRWDRDVSGGVPVFGTLTSPRQNAFTLAVNVVYQF